VVGTTGLDNEHPSSPPQIGLAVGGDAAAYSTRCGNTLRQRYDDFRDGVFPDL
jgi:hypothetical protein